MLPVHVGGPGVFPRANQKSNSFRQFPFRTLIVLVIFLHRDWAFFVHRDWAFFSPHEDTGNWGKTFTYDKQIEDGGGGEEDVECDEEIA